MELLFCNILGQLGMSLGDDVLPAPNALLLEYIGGIPGNLPLLFAALAQSEDSHKFSKSKLLLGLSMAKEHPERYCWLSHVPTAYTLPWASAYLLVTVLQPNPFCIAYRPKTKQTSQFSQSSQCDYMRPTGLCRLKNVFGLLQEFVTTS